MRNIKRIVLLCVMAVMLCCLWNQPVYATETIISGECGENVTWSLDKSTGVFTVSGTGAMTDYEQGMTPWYDNRNLIESVVVEDGISRVGNHAFDYSFYLTDVELAGSVTSIGKYAFQADDALKNIKMDGVTVIEEEAFSACMNLSELEWPDSLTTIEDRAFSRCEQLNNGIFPETLKSIGAYAFAYCYSMDEVVLPESLTEIGDYTFELCSGIKKITLPDSMTELSDFMFRGCSELRQADLPENLKCINQYAFADCVKLTWLWIPNGVEEIGASAFEGCTRIERIVIPGSVKSIGYAAFYCCPNLNSACYFGDENEWNKITIAGYNDILLNLQREYDPKIYTSYVKQKEVTCVENGVLTYISEDNETRTEEITALGHRYLKGENSTQWICEECGDVVTTASDTLGYGSYGPNLTWILSSDGKLTVSGYGAMVNAKILKEVPWYDLRKSIVSAVVEEGVTSLGDESFSHCIEMTDIDIADTVIEIGVNAFDVCSKLQNVQLSERLVRLGNNAFSSCNVMAEINFPDSLQYIGDYAFYNCIKLEKIKFSESLLNIGQYAFSYCDGLQEIVLPESLEVLGKYAFNSCGGLKTVILPNELNSMGIFAFRGCELLENINIPAGITEIGKQTFDGCKSLVSVVIPENITNIGMSAYYNCEGLKEVTILSETCTIEKAAFGNCAEDLMIKGYTGSPAEVYATENSIDFISLGETESEETPDIEHVHKFEACAGTDPTCTEAGYIEYACVGCWDENVTYREELKALGHSYGKGVVTKATVSKNGVIKYTCSRCKSVKKTTIYYPKSITLSATSYTYKGKVRKPSVTVKGSDGKVISASNYTVSYASGRKNVGKYSVKVTFKGKYSGSVTKTFKIVPKGTSISKLTKARKAFTVKWNKQSSKMSTSRISGYQIQYSTNKKFTSGVKTKTVSGYSKTSKKITSLKAKKTYYVRVRTYKTVKFNGKSTKLYSGWSTVKSLKTK